MKKRDCERVPNVSDTIDKVAHQVICTAPMKLVVKLPGILTGLSLLFPCSHYVLRSERQRSHVAQSSSWRG